MKPIVTPPLWPLPMAALFAVSACAPSPTDADAEPASVESGVPTEVETVSILRPEIELPEAEPTPVAFRPYQATVGFPAGGSALDPDALATLKATLGSAQLALGTPITLRAHSDSSGSDRANLNASEKRGLAVAQWLVGNGVDADRITVVAFGEQNPEAPNALPDGSPNAKGRSANRRVEIEIAAEAQTADEAPGDAPTEAESEAASVEAGD